MGMYLGIDKEYGLFWKLFYLCLWKKWWAYLRMAKRKGAYFGNCRIGGVFMDGIRTGGVFLNGLLGGVFTAGFRMGTVLAVGRSFGRGSVSTTPEYRNHWQVSREPRNR